MVADEYRLGIDFGTSSTVAALAGPDGRIRPLLFDASPLLPSAVFAHPPPALPKGAGPTTDLLKGAGPTTALPIGAGPTTALLTGADAERAALAHPAGLEPSPKRRVDDGEVWLGERAYPVVDLIAAVLDRVAQEAHRVAGRPPASVVMTHPAAWSHSRLGVLADAAALAGLGEVGFVAEPVAAAAYFAVVLGREVLPGNCLVVYDLGAGTFDVSVARPAADGFEVVAVAGLDDVGGADLDALVVGHCRALTAGDSAVWQRLDRPRTSADHQARHALWRGARAAKEQLSRHAAADVYVPFVDTEVRLTREEFEKAARPHLERTADLTLTVLRRAGISREHIGGVFLVGGSSRIPLAATLLHRALRVAPTAIDQPELVVADGSLRVRPVAARRPARPAHAPAVPTAGSQLPAPHLPLPPPPSRRRNAVLAAAAVVVLAAIVAAVVTLQPWTTVKVGSRITPPPKVHYGATLAGHTGQVVDVAFSPDGDTVATTSIDRTILLSDVARGEPIGGPLTGHTDMVLGVAFSPDGDTLATTSIDRTVRLWDVASRRPIGEPLTGHIDSVVEVAFSPFDGRTLATVSRDRTVRLWDVASRRPIGEPLTGHTEAVYDVAFSPDGAILATAGEDRTVRLWDVPGHRPIGEPLTGHTNTVYAMAFSPDGTMLATAGKDRTVRLWDVRGHRPIGEPLTGHTGTVVAMRFSADGGILTTAGEDRAVWFWDVAGHRPIGRPLTGFIDVVSGAAFSPDGTTFATTAGAKTARLWEIIH